MTLEELSRKSYLAEEWYAEQTPLWDELSSIGWSFSCQAYIPGIVGIDMQKGHDSATFRVDAGLTREEINSRLLAFCMAFNATDGDDSA